MIGAVTGDICGSCYEWDNIKSKDFVFFGRKCHPTDDSVMTLAVAEALLAAGGDRSLLAGQTVICMRREGRRYPDAGYGGRFRAWLASDEPMPYNSYGNGSAMRVSPCAYAAESLQEAEELAEITAGVTHDHPEGLKGAAAVSAAVYMALHGRSMDEIREYIDRKYYRMDIVLDEIRDDYSFDVSCSGSVPQALTAFFESEGFEDAVRNAVSIGGDSDTIAAICGSVAGAYYGVPEDIREKTMGYLDERQKKIVYEFEKRYPYGKNTYMMSAD